MARVGPQRHRGEKILLSVVLIISQENNLISYDFFFCDFIQSAACGCPG